MAEQLGGQPPRLGRSRIAALAVILIAASATAAAAAPDRPSATGPDVDEADDTGDADRTDGDGLDRLFGGYGLDQGADDARVRDPRAIPDACRRYAAGSAVDPGYAWNQLLSFAACAQDASIAAITDPVQLAPSVDQLYDALAPTMMLYLEAIEHGPLPVQLRAAYGVGMASLSLTTRLRSSLVTPGDRSDAAAMARYRALQGALEPMLVRAQRTAWLAFAVIDRAAALDPSVRYDAVTRNAIASARAMLRMMAGPAREPGRRLRTTTGWDPM